jgi:hypothetical protein
MLGEEHGGGRAHLAPAPMWCPAPEWRLAGTWWSVVHATVASRHVLGVPWQVRARPSGSAASMPAIPCRNAVEVGRVKSRAAGPAPPRTAFPCCAAQRAWARESSQALPGRVATHRSRLTARRMEPPGPCWSWTALPGLTLTTPARSRRPGGTGCAVCWPRQLPGPIQAGEARATRSKTARGVQAEQSGARWSGERGLCSGVTAWARNSLAVQPTSEKRVSRGAAARVDRRFKCQGEHVAARSPRRVVGHSGSGTLLAAHGVQIATDARPTLILHLTQAPPTPHPRNRPRDNRVPPTRAPLHRSKPPLAAKRPRAR